MQAYSLKAVTREDAERLSQYDKKIVAELPQDRFFRCVQCTVDTVRRQTALERV